MSLLSVVELGFGSLQIGGCLVSGNFRVRLAGFQVRESGREGSLSLGEGMLGGRDTKSGELRWSATHVVGSGEAHVAVAGCSRVEAH